MNLYTYCWNNPISLIDPTGHIALNWVVFGISTVKGAITGWVNAQFYGHNQLLSVAAGAITGAISGLDDLFYLKGFDPIFAGLSGFVGNIFGQLLDGKQLSEIDLLEAGASAIIGAIGSLVSTMTTEKIVDSLVGLYNKLSEIFNGYDALDEYTSWMLEILYDIVFVDVPAMFAEEIAGQQIDEYHMEEKMKCNDKTISLVEICCESIFLVFEIFGTLGLILMDSFFISLIFALIFIPYTILLFINSIKEYFMEVLIDESGIKRYYKKQMIQDIFWEDIYEIGLIERKKRYQICPPYIVISKEPVDICDKKYLDMRGIYSKRATIVILYTYDIYTELKKYHNKNIMYYKKGTIPKKWDELISIERYPWAFS